MSEEPTMQQLVERAERDLSARLGLDVAAHTINVMKASYVTWPSSALGCPKPGDFYATVLTPGALIELEVGGEVYRYHSSRNGPPFLCESPEPESPVDR